MSTNEEEVIITEEAPADSTWAENNDESDDDDDDDDDVAPGRENKKRQRPESVVTDGQNKSAKTSADENEDEADGDADDTAVQTITVSVPSNLAGCVIGRGGTVIKATREASGANVNVSKEEIAPGLREVSISGQAHQVQAARLLVIAQVEAKKQQNEEAGESEGPPPGTTTTVIQVPNSKVGGLIGKGGSSINEIRNVSGCRINIQDSKHGGGANRDITIIGMPDQVQQAQALIQQKLTEIIARENNGGGRRGGGGMYGGQGGGYGPPPGYGGQGGQQQQQQQGGGYGGGRMQAWNGQGGQQQGGQQITTQVSVPDESVGRLIGRGGETINRIRQASACRIDIAKSDAQSQANGLRIITLSGTEQTIKMAQDMLRQKLAEAQQQQNGNYGQNGGGGQQQDASGGQGGQGANPWGPIGGQGVPAGYPMGGFGGGGYAMMPNGGQPGYGAAQAYNGAQGQGGGAGGAKGAPGTGNPY